MVLLVSRSASSDKRGNFVPFCCFLSLPTVYKYKLRSSSMRDRSFYLTRRSPRCLCLCERANRDGYSERTRRNDHLKTYSRENEGGQKKEKKRKKERKGNRIDRICSFDRSIVLIVDIRRISKVFFLFILISLFLSFFFFSSSSSSSSSSFVSPSNFRVSKNKRQNFVGWHLHVST